MGIFSRAGRSARHETANRARGARARQHLAKARQRELRRLRSRERDRDRRRVLAGATDPRVRLRRFAIIAVPLALGLGLASALDRPLERVAGSSMRAIDTIAIQGHIRLSSAEVAAATGISRGASLAEIDTEAVAARLATEPWIREAHVLRLPPSTLLVRVTEREPRAILIPAKEPGQPRLVDGGGTPFVAETLDRDLPRIVGGESLENDTAHAVLLTAIDVLEHLHAAGGSALADTDGRLDLHLPRQESSEGWVVRGAAEVVLGEGELGERFARLSRLLRSRTLADSQAGVLRIDLRFADQAVLSDAGTGGRG